MPTPKQISLFSCYIGPAAQLVAEISSECTQDSSGLLLRGLHYDLTKALDLLYLQPQVVRQPDGREIDQEPVDFVPAFVAYVMASVSSSSTLAMVQFMSLVPLSILTCCAVIFATFG